MIVTGENNSAAVRRGEEYKCVTDILMTLPVNM